MRPIPLIAIFCLSLLLFFLTPYLFPGTRLMTFSPFLAVFLMRKSLLPSLWAGALVGLFMDLFNHHIRFGLFSISTLLACFIAYRLKPYFHREGLFSLPFFAGAISLFTALLQIILVHSYFDPTQVLLPIADALFTLIVFSLPLSLYSRMAAKTRRVL